MARVGDITLPMFKVCPYKTENRRVALIPTIQSALALESAASYKSSNSLPSCKFLNPSVIALSSIEEIHKRFIGLLHPSFSYTKRKISSPSRPESVAAIIVVTSLCFINAPIIFICFSLPFEITYLHSLGKIGKSSYCHLVYFSSYRSAEASSTKCPIHHVTR